ncbi:translation initiation factor IF-2-like [Bubalus kerabau]|uniref:translation initiation factor IF-2-like n=1 Tax=Bubalus carabanensis TaxID=3119969 RepID=UPI00244E766F|nr:translation initiation factor IF-2-like [Bubalus carabanensis]
MNNPAETHAQPAGPFSLRLIPSGSSSLEGRKNWAARTGPNPTRSGITPTAFRGQLLQAPPLITQFRSLLSLPGTVRPAYPTPDRPSGLRIRPFHRPRPRCRLRPSLRGPPPRPPGGLRLRPAPPRELTGGAGPRRSSWASAPGARPPPQWPPAAVAGCARASARRCPGGGCPAGSSSSCPGFGGWRAPARPGSGSPRNITPSPGSKGAWPGGARRGDRAAVTPGGAARWKEAAASDQTRRGEGRDHFWPMLGRREIGGPSRDLPKDLLSSPQAARPGAFISPAPSSGPLHQDRRKFTTKWAVSFQGQFLREAIPDPPTASAVPSPHRARPLLCGPIKPLFSSQSNDRHSTNS